MSLEIAAETLEDFVEKLEKTGLLAKVAAHDPVLLALHAVEHLEFCAGIYSENDYDNESMTCQRDGIKATTLPPDNTFFLSCTVPFDEIEPKINAWRSVGPNSITFDFAVDKVRSGTTTE